MPSYDIILNAFVVLFVTIDPIGMAAIFLGVTKDLNASQRRNVAYKSVFISLLTLIAFALVGTALLSTLGITIHAFRVAGGLLLFYISFEMIFEKRQERQEEATKKLDFTKDHLTSLAVFPLAIPLIAGPGSISAAILLSNEIGKSWQGEVIILSIIAFVLLLVLLSFLASGFINKYLGDTVRMILTRLLGLLLAALAVQFVADGVLALAQ